MPKQPKLPNFRNIGFDDFRRLAQDKSLSRYEKIGFPNSYRKGKEELIFSDLLAKLPALSRPGATVVDIGCGCSDLAHLLIKHCGRKRQKLVMIDSKEMLDLLPDRSWVTKETGRFPEMPGFLKRFHGKADAVIAYSVFHYIFAEGNLHGFLDHATSLLADGGEMLIGDIPNSSMRKRFFSSAAGVRFHQKFMKTRSKPKVSFSRLETGEIDDGAIFGILQRYRGYGFDTYVLPQPSQLPMANRREDLLIRKA